MAFHIWLVMDSPSQVLTITKCLDLLQNLTLVVRINGRKYYDNADNDGHTGITIDSSNRIFVCGRWHKRWLWWKWTYLVL